LDSSQLYLSTLSCIRPSIAHRQSFGSIPKASSKKEQLTFIVQTAIMCPDIGELFAVIEEFGNALRNKCTATPATATDWSQELDDFLMTMEVMTMEVELDIIQLWQHFK
jgi:hypothetical protein